MDDRTPTPGQEGRVLITPENGSAPFYAKVTMADNPTNQGTPLNKETLLQDSTEIEIFGNASNRTVAEAFSGIMDRIDLIMQNVASMALTITDTAGNPIPGVYVNGVFDDDGNAVKTNASGQINGYVAEGDSTLSITSYADITPYSEVFTAVKGQSYTKTIQVTTRNFLQILSSAQYRFSENVTQVDETVVGAGGGGGAGDVFTGEMVASSGGGGGGGECVVSENVSFSPNIFYPALVGSAGLGATRTRSATPGGSSSFLGVTAAGGTAGGNGEYGNGGAAGVGNGNGGEGVEGPGYPSYVTNGNNGNPGTVQGYSSFTEMMLYSGGGGSGAATNDGHDGSGGIGGAPFGGKGGNTSYGHDLDGGNATGYGGAGGGSGAFSDGESDDFGPGGDGYQGLIAIRMHLATAA